MSEPVALEPPALFNPTRPLDEMQAAHALLLTQQRALSAGDAAADEHFTRDVAAFVQRAMGSGAYLEGDRERQEAQTLIDYWVTRLIRRNSALATSDSTLADFDESLAPELPDEPSPYQGLQAFREQDRAFFFGRERLVEKLVARIQSGERLLAVVGASGSGKSSLVLAGLLPRLRDATPADMPIWQFVTMVPGSDPLSNLAAALSATDASLPRVVVVDQFEELFTLCKDEAAQRAFAAQLLNLTEAEPPCVVVLTMRLDYVGNVARLPEFYARFQTARIDVGVLDINELREAIEKPAAAVGLRFDDGIVDDLVTTILGEGAGLPLLQFTLLKLWKARKRNRITAAVYKKVGNPRQALERSAEALFADMMKEDQDAVKHIFLQMVQPGEGSEFTSSRIRREAVFVGGPASDRVERALERLIGEGLVKETTAPPHPSPLTAHPPPSERERGARTPSPVGTGEGRGGDLTNAITQIEVAHEALVRNWPRLVGWLDEAREGLRERNRLRDAARLWAASNHDPSLLLRGRALDEAERLASQGEAEFVQASRAAADAETKEREQTHLKAMQLEQERKTGRRLRTLVAAVLVMALAAFGLAGWAYTQTQRAFLAEAEAQRQSDIAQSRYLAIESERQRTAQPYLSPLLALEARHLADTSEARSSLFYSTNNSPPLNLRLWHEAGVRSVAFAPDGKSLASASADNSVILWDLADPRAPKQLSTLAGHASPVSSVAFAPDGKSLASASADRSVILWDLADPRAPKQLSTLAGHASVVRSVAFAPDGKSLASASDDTSVILWDLADPRAPKQLSTLAGHASVVRSVAFAPDGKSLASASDDTSVILWDLADPRAPKQLSTLAGHASPVSSVAFALDGKSLASASADNSVILWDLADPRAPKQLSTLAGHANDVNSVAFAPDGKSLASASADNSVILWDLADPRAPKQLSTLAGHTRAVYSVAFAPDGKSLASASADRSVILWDLADPRAPKQLSTLAGHIFAVRSVAFAPDGKSLASASADRSVILWDLADPRAPKQLSTLAGHASPVSSVAFAPDGKSLASASADNSVILWDLADPRAPKQLSTLAGHASDVLSVAFAPDGKSLASASADRSVILWDLADPRAPKQLSTLAGHIFAVRSVAFAPDGKSLASASDDTSVILWDLADPRAPKQLSTLAGHASVVRSVAFAPDGKSLASASWDDSVILWDLADPRAPKQLSTLAGHANDVNSVAFAPDGKSLASASDDTSVILWDLADPRAPKQLSTLAGHTRLVNSVAFAPDGKSLASASDDKSVILWDVDLESWRQIACRVAGRNLSLGEWRRFFGDAPYRKTCPELPLHSSLLEEGRQLARAGKLDQAITRFRTLQKMEPNLNPEIEARTAAVESLLAQARTLAREADLQGAQAKLKEARALQSGLSTDLEAELQQFVVNALVQQAKGLAGQGDLAAAQAKLKEARALQPNLPTALEAELQQPVVNALVQQAKELAGQGDLAAAQAKLKEARALQPNLPMQLDAELKQLVIYGQIAQAAYLANSGSITEALTSYRAAVAQDANFIKQVSPADARDVANSLNGLCWDGSLRGYAQDVLDACEKAVTLAPNDGGIRDSRGVAYALTNQIDKAIEDFQAFVVYTDNSELRTQRQQWIDALKAGKDPKDVFNDSVLKALQEQ